MVHGATGKGNDQVRFELAYYALKPDITVIAPWREWDLTSRTRLLAFAEEHQIPIAKDKRGKPRSRSMRTCCTPPLKGSCWKTRRSAPRKSCSSAPFPRSGPRQGHRNHHRFRIGRSGRDQWRGHVPATLLTRLNELGRDNGIGRLDLVENRFVGMKSRGIYETPGGTILLTAHRSIESITLDREAMHLKDSLMPRYAEIIYNGLWFSPNGTCCRR